MRNLALRFLRTRKLRTGLSILSVLLGTGLLAALLTLSATMEQALDQQIARNFGTYDLMAGYHEPGRYLSPGDEAAVRQMQTVTGLAGVLIPQLDSLGRGQNVGLIYYGVPNTPLGRQFQTPKQGLYPGPGEVAISEGWAKMRGLSLGDTAKLPMAGDQTVKVRISGLLPSLKLNGAQVIFERDWLAQQVGQPGATFLLIEQEEGASKAGLTNAIQDRFPEITIYDRSFLKEIRQNLDALRPVAHGLGIASLLASAFLLTGAFRMSLAERTRELAVLRAIAATPGQVRRMILTEGVLVGVTGSLLGALLGGLGATLASGGVAAMLGVEPSAPAIPWLSLSLVAVAGTLMTILSARGVARAAGQTEPLRAMRPDLPTQEQGARRGGLFGLGLIGLGLTAIAAVPLLPTLLPEGSDGLQALAGSTGALAVAVGLLLATQRLLPLLLPFLLLPFRRTTEGPLAVRSILRHRRRSGLTVGAMGLGLILVVAIATIMGTLARNMQADIRKRHPADIQVMLPGVVRQGLSPQILDEIRQVDGVSTLGATYDTRYLLRQPRGFRARDLIGISTAEIQPLVAMKAYTVLQGSVEQLGPTDLVLHTSFAQTKGFALGDKVTLNLEPDFQMAQSAPELREYRVAAIVDSYHYALPHVMVTSPVPGKGTAGVRMIFANADPTKLAAAREAVRGILAQPPYTMAEYSDAESALAEMQVQLYQRYALVGAVALVMAAVAAMSLVNAMVNAINERKREFALLRAVGATPEQVRNTILLEGSFLGLVGGLVDTLGGVILAAGALFGLEPEHFNQLSLPWPVLGAGLLLSLLLALLAALGPARQVMQVAPAEAVRID